MSNAKVISIIDAEVREQELRMRLELSAAIVEMESKLRRLDMLTRSIEARVQVLEGGRP